MSVGSVRVQLRAQLRESIREAILEAAEELIATNGLTGAPLAQIARRAGVAVGTLYNYFADRDALIAALFELRRASLRPQLRAALEHAGAGTFEERLRRFLRHLFAVFEANRRFIKVAIETEHLRPSPSTTAQDLTAAIRELVDAGRRAGAITAERAELLPLVIGGAMRAIVHQRIAANAALSPADADALVTLLLRGALG